MPVGYSAAMRHLYRPPTYLSSGTIVEGRVENLLESEGGGR